jgi:energy-coupling factor transporter ATP-binding protein EcfA2
MYAGELSPAGPVPTTLRGLIEGGTMTTAQAARLASYVSDRRTLLIFGDRSTGKSTLLNALLELIPVDERLVSIEHSDHLPALQDRSFCVRLSVDDDTDVEGIFAKAMKMQPSRIVVGEVHADEILYFLRELRSRPESGGFCTVRADSVHLAVAKLLRQMERTSRRPTPGSSWETPGRCSYTCAATSAATRGWRPSGESRDSTPTARSCCTKSKRVRAPRPSRRCGARRRRRRTVRRPPSSTPWRRHRHPRPDRHPFSVPWADYYS